MGLHVKMFEGPVPSDLLCSVCRYVLVQPELSATCPHVFCSTCLQERVCSPCPQCGTVLQNMPRRPAPAQTRLRLLELRIHCDHKCGEVMALGKLPQHVSHVCPNTPVPCDFEAAGCRKKVRRCDLAEHAQECDFRPVACEACGYKTLFKDLHVHQSRKRCVEMRIKNQLIKALKTNRKEVKRHHNHIQKQQVKTDQTQRRLEVEHARRMTTARRLKQLQKNYNLTSESGDEQSVCNFVTTIDLSNGTSDHESSLEQINYVPNFHFSSLQDTSSNITCMNNGRSISTTKGPEQGRITLSKEIGNLLSPRGLVSREKSGHNARPLLSREKKTNTINGLVSLPGRITTSRDRLDQTIARLAANREKISHAETGQPPPELFLTADHDETLTSAISSNDHDIQMCRNCRRSYREGRNKNNSCRWHAGPIIELFGGTCYSCGRLDYQRGCMMGRHEQLS